MLARWRSSGAALRSPLPPTALIRQHLHRKSQTQTGSALPAVDERLPQALKHGLGIPGPLSSIKRVTASCATSVKVTEPLRSSTACKAFWTRLMRTPRSPSGSIQADRSSTAKLRRSSFRKRIRSPTSGASSVSGAWGQAGEPSADRLASPAQGVARSGSDRASLPGRIAQGDRR